MASAGISWPILIDRAAQLPPSQVFDPALRRAQAAAPFMVAALEAPPDADGFLRLVGGLRSLSARLGPRVRGEMLSDCALHELSKTRLVFPAASESSAQSTPNEV